MKPIRILHLEDSIRDAKWIHDLLEISGLEAKIMHVTDKASFEAEVFSEREYDIVLCDHNLTGYDGFSALELARQQWPLTPFLIISGSIGEEEAVRGLQKGATDYLLKERLERLPEAIRRALREAEDRRRRLETEKNLRENEERMRLALAATNDAIWDYNEASSTLVVNDTFKKLFGEPPMWSDHDWWAERLHPEDRPEVIESWRKAKEEANPTWFGRYRFKKLDGTWAHVENRACISYDEEGLVVRVVGAIQDCTERVQKEEQRKALEEQLTQAQKLEAIGTLAGGIAHDFNNILGIIIANAEIAKAELKMPGTDKASVSECLDETLRASRRGRDLVRQILTFSRREETKLHLINPVEVIGECVRMLRSTLPAMVRLDAQLPKHSLMVRGNETQLQQVIMNLCTNAWHALQGGEGRIEVILDDVSYRAPFTRGSLTIPAGNYVRICVCDNGSGIPLELQSRIFDPFFTTKAPGVGTGLGLSVVHGIVRNWGGMITVKSKPGKGTEFCLLFPAHEGEASSTNTEEDPLISGKGRKILLVDDDLSMASGTERVLQRAGYEVTTFNAPEKALECLLLGDQNFELVITDYSMPGITGAELAQHIFDHDPNLPVILLTGMGDTQVRRQAQGVTAIAEKPIWPEELCRLVGRILLSKEAKATDRKYRVLVIDDDPAHLSACARMLRQANYSVNTAQDGEQALKMLNSLEVDVVLTDIIMPEKEGLEVIMTLRKLHPEIRIIAMSGGGRMSAEDCLSLSKSFKADQTLLKPFSRDELLERLQAVLETEPQRR